MVITYVRCNTCWVWTNYGVCSKNLCVSLVSECFLWRRIFAILKVYREVSEWLKEHPEISGESVLTRKRPPFTLCLFFNNCSPVFRIKDNADPNIIFILLLNNFLLLPSLKFTERCPSGLRSTLGKRVYAKSVPRVRIPLSLRKETYSVKNRFLLFW